MGSVTRRLVKRLLESDYTSLRSSARDDAVEPPRSDGEIRSMLRDAAED